jgi:hypothetical protein
MSESQKLVGKLTSQKQYYDKHREQILQRHRDYYAANPEKFKALRKQQRDLNKRSYDKKKEENPFDCPRKYEHLKKVYGLTKEAYEDLLCAQGGCCAICEREPEVASPKAPYLSVDHNHETGKIRGLLCNPCNRGIGYLQDDVIITEKAAAYLKRHGS